MMECRTSKLDFSHFECPNCHNHHIQFHSCKSKFCTSRSNKYSKERVISIESKLYNCNHRHLVFTIHDVLWNLFREDSCRLNYIFEAASITIKFWFKIKYKKKNLTPAYIYICSSQLWKKFNLEFTYSYDTIRWWY